MNPLKKVMVALDIAEADKAMALVEEVSEQIDWFKIGPMLYTQAGPKLIQFLHQKRKKIFLDLKLYDTPYVVSETMKQFSDEGVHFASVHCSGGRKMLEAAGKFCRNSQLKLIGIGWLTSHEPKDLYLFDVNANQEAVDTRLLTLALESRLSGLMCAPHQIESLKPKALPGFQLIAAGIRLPNEEVFLEDQQRVASPSEALQWGADFLVIGRPIIHTREPKKVLERMFTRA